MAVRKLPPLSSLRTFESAARLGSFKRAAAELGVTPTAISHQMRSLEEHLGLRLFERRPRRIELTEEGRVLFPVLSDALDRVAATIGRLRSRPAQSIVTISATRAFTARWLVPRLARFQDAYPGVELRIQASDEPLDLGAGDVDIAIRYGRGPYPQLNVTPLIADSFAPVANPFLQVAATDDLFRHPLIHFDWQRPAPDNPGWDRWSAAAGMNLDGAMHVRFSDESHAIQAAVAGQGVALVSLALVQDEIAGARLVQPFGPTLEGMTYHLLTRPDADPPAPVRAVEDWLLAEARLDPRSVL